MEAEIQRPGSGSLSRLSDRFDPVGRADDRSSRFAALLSFVLTLATVAAIIIAADRLSLGAIWAIVPTRPAFWGAFVLFYMLTPLCEWIIFRRLWAIPPSGLLALTRKYVANEIVLGYLGDAKFYAWARQHMSLKTAPFGAIKDVAILSAMVGNGITVVMLLAAWPLLRSSVIGLDLRSTMVSLSVVLASSVVILLLRRKLFSLPRAELRFICGVHCARVIFGLLLTALMWEFALPDLTLSDWLLLATLRMLVSRLPLIANKDLVFATLAMFTLGHITQLSSTVPRGRKRTCHCSRGARPQGSQRLAQGRSLSVQ